MKSVAISVLFLVFAQVAFSQAKQESLRIPGKATLKTTETKIDSVNSKFHSKLDSRTLPADSTVRAAFHKADSIRSGFQSKVDSLQQGNVGKSLAYEFSDAHESGPGNPIKENIMDSANNMVGNQLGAGSNLTNSQLMFQIYDLVKTGGLYMLDNGSLVKTHWP